VSSIENGWDAFREEAYELLAELESSLLDLEESPDDNELVRRVFRALHTIKGAGSMSGFDEIADFVHEVEAVFDMVRSGDLSLTKNVLDHTVSACDLIRTMLDSPETACSLFKQKAGEITASLKLLISGPGKEEPDDNPESLAEQEREEVLELLTELESSLLELEEHPDDKELVARVFRALHTIKGSGSLSGFEGLADFIHEVETVFDMVRNDLLPVSAKLADLTLSVCDLIRTMLEAPLKGSKIFEQNYGKLLASINNLTSDAAPRDSDIDFAAQEINITYRIRFRPSLDIIARGINPLLLVEELRTLGHCTVVAQKDEIPLMKDINPESCYTYWDIILTSDKGINAIKDIFIFIENDSDLQIDVIDESGRIGAVADNEKLTSIFDSKGFLTRGDFENMRSPRQRIGDILVERGDLTPEDLQKVLGQQNTAESKDSSVKKRIGDTLVDAEIVDSGKIESALAEQRHVRNVRQKQSKTTPVSSIRVSSDKLDRLVNLVGELVTVQARLTQTSLYRNDPELVLIAEEVESLTEELRENTMSVRLVPIGTLFGKFKRLVRDLSKETGKAVEMVTEGAETELDKTVIERLNDPLVHLIRNSIDHGLESPDVRRAEQKPEYGTIHLSAMHSGANVLIQIKDDGKGIDPGTIRAKAVEKGLIEPDRELSDKDIFAQILSPGFSTAEKITNVSGRGVGMDVVKRSIDDLRGSLEITSKKGIGTTITLKLPLTLAIIDGLLVKIGEAFFVLPLSIVVECVELTQDDIERSHNRDIANVRGNIVPYISLRDKFAINGKKPDMEQIIITEVAGNRVGFVVDHVIGEHQTVIKSLGKAYRHIQEISGATILGDGTLALILDAVRLFQVAEEQSNSKSTKNDSEVLTETN
jgi:two-component system chemotaxis sensor kinase CheA